MSSTPNDPLLDILNAPPAQRPKGLEYASGKEVREHYERNARTLQGRQFHQLPMFMSAREIMDTHVPMEGDRERVMTPEQKRRKAAGEPYGIVRKETDEELWDRKHAESQQYASPYMEGGRMVGASLAESIAKHGVQSPLHLGISEITSSPTVFGGHHRLVSAHRSDPDRLVPVLHHRSVAEAKRPYESGYPYR